MVAGVSMGIELWRFHPNKFGCTLDDRIFLFNDFFWWLNDVKWDQSLMDIEDDLLWLWDLHRPIESLQMASTSNPLQLG